MDPTSSDPAQQKISNLPMKIIIGVLLIVLIFEIGYIFFGSAKRTSKTLTSNSNLNTIFVTPIPMQEFLGKIDQLNPIENIETLKNENIIFSLKLIVNNKPFVFFFNPIELAKIKITDSKGKILSYKNLIVGQNVKLIIVYDTDIKQYKSYEFEILN